MNSLGQSNITIAEGDKEKRKFEIGGVIYLVTALYKEQSNMTAVDKVARLIEKEIEKHRESILSGRAERFRVKLIHTIYSESFWL